MRIQSIKTKIIRPGDDLISLIQGRVKKVKEGSVLAVTSKVVSLWEGRWMPQDAEKRGRLKSQKNAEGDQLEKLVRKEAEKVWPSEHCFLALKDGVLIPNAGVDESNAFGGFILWPIDAFASAKRIHDALARHYKVKKLGVVITDSWTMPLRHGVIGIALGYYGFAGQKDYVGKKDLAGRKLRMTKVSVADTLASTAVLVMGEGNEQTPVAVIEGAPVRFTNTIEKGKLKINPKDDVYRPVLNL